MFRLSRALFSTTLAWMAASFFLFVYGSAYESSSVFSHSIPSVVDGLIVLSCYVAIVVFPTCLLIVAPVLRFLSPDSVLWRPRYACFVAPLFAVLAMWAWAVAFCGGFFIPELHDRVHVGFGVAAILAGVTFAYAYSVGLRRVSGSH
jgi:hypothetical protein